jgi:class 3 adenylate cyclase
VIVGTIGSAVSKSFTAIGDTVNVASRLVGAISDDTLRLARKEIELRELDLITVVGGAQRELLICQRSLWRESKNDSRSITWFDAS